MCLVTDMRMSWALSRSLLLAELTNMPSSSVVELPDDKRLCRPTRPFQPRPGEALWTKHTHRPVKVREFMVKSNCLSVGTFTLQHTVEANFALLANLTYWRSLALEKCNLCVIQCLVFFYLQRGNFFPRSNVTSRGSSCHVFTLGDWNSSHTEFNTVYWSPKGFKPQASRWNLTTCPEHKQKHGRSGHG